MSPQEAPKTVLDEAEQVAARAWKRKLSAQAGRQALLDRIRAVGCIVCLVLTLLFATIQIIVLFVGR